MKTIYKNNDYEYVLYTDAGESQSHARIVRHALQDKEGDVVVFDYSWPAQLTVEVEAGEGSLREDGVLCWQLFVTAHHVSGMVQGEFTETEYRWSRLLENLMRWCAEPWILSGRPASQ